MIDSLINLKLKKGILCDLLIVGDGHLKSYLEYRCRMAKINAYFAGYVEQEFIPRFYGIADIFVLPSYYETFGLVLNEAMACELPVVVSDQVGAADDLVMSGRNGYIFPAGDYAMLGDALGRLIEDSTLRHVMGKASWQIIKRWNFELALQGFYDALVFASKKSSSPDNYTKI